MQARRATHIPLRDVRVEGLCQRLPELLICHTKRFSIYFRSQGPGRAAGSSGRVAQLVGISLVAAKQTGEVLHLGSSKYLTTVNNAPGKSLFQFMGLFLGVFSIE